MRTRMQTAAPAAKVNAATVAAALTTLVLYLINHSLLPTDPLPDPVQLALGVLITAAVTFAAAYLTPPAAIDRVITDAPPPTP